MWQHSAVPHITTILLALLLYVQTLHSFELLPQIVSSILLVGVNGHALNADVTWLLCFLNLCTLLRLFTPLYCDPIFFWYFSYFFYIPPSWLFLLSPLKVKFLQIPLLTLFSVYTQFRWSSALGVFLESLLSPSVHSIVFH